MTLEEFKEKLFKKANMFSVSLDYVGTKYKVGYYTPDNHEKVSVEVEYNHDKKEPNCLWLEIYRNKKWEIEQVTLKPYSFIDDLKAIQNFLNKIEEYGYLDSKN